MKILIEAYNTFRLISGGGVQTKVRSTLKAFNLINDTNISVDVYDKWKTVIDEYDLIHFFKASIDHFNLMKFAKKKGLKIVLSSIIPLENTLKVKVFLFLAKYLKINSVHYLIQQNLVLADLVLAETLKEKRFICETYGINASSIKVIQNGICESLLYSEVVTESFIEKFNIIGDYVLMVGRIDANKNQLKVIKALEKTNIKLVIIGGKDPSDNSGYYEKCLAFCSDKVIFTGWIDGESELLYSAYQNAKVVVLASYKEIYGNCIYEGLANNCLIACSKALEIDDSELFPYISFFNPNDINEIKNSIITLFSKKEKMEIRGYMQTKYSWHSIGQQYIDWYKELK